ncbi:hypothetical protein BDN71DRAFT_1451112 [Pleurotus eryngii]|uniref:SAP domain-containing protein n=1 Tax=Pleurotus eryngii TaxID=5323 RepID=A0A9P5ZQL1_PLEER|nr:hypothetical protein BDN71DRAFT_1451112 [Pleurotus eryngii]
MSTTQILFNSPALHSLKRDQLVKLCKIHSIKASGKNTDLVEKLKQHALSLQQAEQEGNVTGEANDDMDGIEVAAEAQLDSSQEAEHTDSSNTPDRRQMPRPSEQWEVVMDSIDEEEEGSSQNTVSSKGTLRTIGGSGNTTLTGEFGTGGSKTSLMSSSLKAFATSLGLNRAKGGSAHPVDNTSTSMSDTSFASIPSSVPSLPNTVKKLDYQGELIATSAPYSSLPQSNNPPQTDHLTFVPPSPLPGAFVDDSDPMVTTEDATPLPGHPLRPGRPAPSAPNVRMSLGLNTPARDAGPTTTIRLVSGSVPNVPSLFNNPDSGDKTTTSWGDTTWAGGDTPKLKPFATSFDLVLGSPGPLYPPLSLDELVNTQAGRQASSSKPQPIDAVLGTPSKKAQNNTKSTLAPPPKAPFIFGSPLPQHRISNAQFQDAAKSVLDEMNQRLAGEGIQSVSTDVLKQLGPTQRVNLSDALKTSSLDTSPSRDRQAERAAVREKFNRAHEDAFSKMAGIDEPVGAGRKRKSNVLLEKRELAGVRKRSSIGVAVRQGGIGVNRASGARVISGGRKKAARVIPGGFDESDRASQEEEDEEAEEVERGGKRIKVQDEEAEAEVARKEKEREMVKRKLEKNKAARRSSMGVARQSMGRGRASLSRNAVPKPKPSRFGFLSSAKSLVQGMWKGKSSAKAPAVPTNTNIPVPAKPAPLSSTTKASTSKKPLIGRGAVAPTGSSVAGGSTKRVTSGSSSSSNFLHPGGAEKSNTAKSNSSSRSRSPIPSFNTPGGSKASLGRTSTSGAVSSIGTRSGTRQNPTGARTSIAGTALNLVGARTTSGISSLGTRNSRLSSTTGSTDASSKNAKSMPSTSRLSSSSRLMAPTASSLAKTHSRGSTTGLDVVKEKDNSRPSQGIATTPSSKPGIFNKHLMSAPFGIPTPVRTTGTFTSFGGAAVSIASSPVKEDHSDFAPKPIAPKPRSLIGRKPRISRSKVIAKLASKRDGPGPSGKVIRTSLDPRVGAGRTRSSLGAKVQREGLGGGLKSRKAEAVLMAKKRARASEYARRKSLKGYSGDSDMKVDD